MFVVTVVFKVQAGSVEDFRRLVLRQAKNSLEQEPGCRRFDVCFDDDRPQRVLLYEIYDDRAAFDSHRDTAHFEAFNEAVGPLLEARTLDFWTLQPSD